jgi:hypothetical protein
MCFFKEIDKKGPRNFKDECLLSFLLQRHVFLYVCLKLSDECFVFGLKGLICGLLSCLSVETVCFNWRILNCTLATRL